MPDKALGMGGLLKFQFTQDDNRPFFWGTFLSPGTLPNLSQNSRCHGKWLESFIPN
jgi:hypothetical protein